METPTSSANSTRVTIKREEYIKLLIQTLEELGFTNSKLTLEKESGIKLYESEVEELNNLCLEGKWVEVEKKVNSFEIDPAMKKRALVAVYQQKYLEFLECGEFVPALECLRKELSQEMEDNKTLNKLSSLMICKNADELKMKAGWVGLNGGSRANVVDQLREFIIGRDHYAKKGRLEEIIQKATEEQIKKCIYHNVVSPVLSLFHDHECHADSLPTRPAFSLVGHKDEVWGLKFSTDGNLLATFSQDGSIFIWDMKPIYADVSGSPLLHNHNNNNNNNNSSTNYNNNNNNNNNSHNNGNTPHELWHVQKVSKCVVELKGHTAAVTCVAWGPRNERLLSAGKDNTVRVWEVSTGTCVQVLARHRDLVNAVVFFPPPHPGHVTVNAHEGWFASGSVDKSIVVCDAQGAEKKVIPTLQIVDMVCVRDAHHQPWLVTAQQKKVILYDLEGKSVTFTESEPITALAVSSDHSTLLVSLVNYQIHMWDLWERKLIGKFEGNKQTRYAIRCCFGGVGDNFVASGSEDGKLFLWHRSTATPIAQLGNAHTASVNAVSWSPRSPAVLATCGDDHAVTVWIAPAQYHHPHPSSPVHTPVNVNNNSNNNHAQNLK